jgi:uncharacterized membrane protein (GlpM family)
MNTVFKHAILVIISLLIITPEMIMAPILGVTNILVEVPLVLLTICTLSKTGRLTKVFIIILLALFFTFPPVPNYILATDNGMSIQWIGFENMLDDRVPIIERFIFFGICWFAISRVLELKFKKENDS